jgi:Uma2 family endonuclease
MSGLASVGEKRTLRTNVSWTEFIALAKGDRPIRGRLTYDRGVLEIMSPSYAHERITGLIEQLVRALAAEWGLPISTARSSTLLRERAWRGKEPDASFHIGASVEAVSGIEDLDIGVHPAPDLAIEVEMSKSALDILSIFAVLGVREVWRFRDGCLSFHILEIGGCFRESATSAVLAPLAAKDLEPFLKRWNEGDENVLLREFQSWARARAPRR